jgi:REP element-mobilizing transposase RayT
MAADASAGVLRDAESLAHGLMAATRRRTVRIPALGDGHAHATLARASRAGYCYHVLNRGNARKTVFHKDGDFGAFVKLLKEAQERMPIRLLSYCLMPNHFHLAVWPQHDDDLSDFMMWLMTAHVCRYHPIILPAVTAISGKGVSSPFRSKKTSIYSCRSVPSWFREQSSIPHFVNPYTSRACVRVQLCSRS